MIYLTDEQRQALRQTGDSVPLPVYDPQTSQAYFLLPSALYDRVRAHLEEPTAEEDAEIPPGIRRSKAAFLRDLPELLKNRKLKGRWVIYHGDERIGVHWKPEKLIHECNRRGLKPVDYYLAIIQEHEAEPVEIERSPAGFDWEEEGEGTPPSTPPQ
jgi:hypothetical protein